MMHKLCRSHCTYLSLLARAPLNAGLERARPIQELKLSSRAAAPNKISLSIAQLALELYFLIDRSRYCCSFSFHSNYPQYGSSSRCTCSEGAKTLNGRTHLHVGRTRRSWLQSSKAQANCHWFWSRRHQECRSQHPRAST
jgi:hypothetical protein